MRKLMEKNFDKLKIGNKFFNSRLMLGTGKYKTAYDALNSIESSESDIVTVTVRRLPNNLKNDTINFLNKLNVNNEILSNHKNFSTNAVIWDKSI